MSWFDATSLTSYAKTALASAQKSIDKVLDIDESQESGSQSKTTSKANATEKVETRAATENSNSKQHSLTPKTSREKLSIKNESKSSGDDFWSSFLGSSQNNSSSSSSSSSGVAANKVSTKKSSRQREVLSHKKSDTKLTTEIPKAKNKELISKDVDVEEDKKIGNDFDLENRTEISERTKPEAEGTKTPRTNRLKKHEDKSIEEPLAKQALKNTTDKALYDESKATSSLNDKSFVKNSTVTKIEFESESNVEKEIDLNLHEENDFQEDQSLGQTSEEPFQASKDGNEIKESIPEPMAASTPYTHKETCMTDSTLESMNKLAQVKTEETDFNDITEEDKVDSADNVRILKEQDDTDVLVDRKLITKREPREDDCEEEVIKGVLYKADDDDTINDDGSIFLQEITSDNITNVREPCETNDHDENNLVLKKSIDVSGNSDNGNSLLTGALTAEGHSENREEIEQDRSENEVQLRKEISSLKELVNARESKMIALSKENIDLQETNTILRSQIDQLENMHAGENEEFEEMKEEFTTRIALVENKFHQVSKERDTLKTELEETAAHLTAVNERQHEEFSTLITEKDEQIAQLLNEGEKLSKQELQSNTVIKKLRSKEKENDALIKKQTKKLEEYSEEVKRLTEILTSRDDSNSKQEDAIIKLNAYVKKQEEQLAMRTSELEDANEKVRSTQVALDNAYKEMTSLQKQTASTEGTIKEAVLSTEMKAKEELRMALERTRREFHQESEMMALQVADLQASLSRTEQQGTRREENLRQEIKHLQQRLQESEDRNQELASSVSHATRPLLRQIENLQTTHSGQTSTWERVEKSLTERLNEAQNQLLLAQENERVASQDVSELNSRITRLESQVNSYRAERSRLEADLELERTKNGSLEDAQSRDTAKYDAMVKKYQKLIEDANLDKAHLEQQLTVEKSKMATEIKKLKTALEDKNKMLNRQSSVSSALPTSPSATANSESFLVGKQQDSTDSSTNNGRPRTSSSSSSVADVLARGMMGGTTALVERLQAQVRQKDGEIELLQDDVTSLRQSRDSVTEEMTSLTTKLEEMERLKDIKEKYDVLQQRYNAVLQMYGEKEEEVDELRMDLQDVKNMYKQQLEQLFGSR